MDFKLLALLLYQLTNYSDAMPCNDSAYVL